MIRWMSVLVFAFGVLQFAGCSEMDGDGMSETGTSPRAERLFDRLAYVSDRDGNFEISVLDERGQTRLTDHPARDVAPAWSPDGSKIAFVSDRSGRSELFVMNADGSDVAQITTFGVDEYPPAWSFDGKRIAFSGSGGICYMNADGTGVMRVVNGGFPSWYTASPLPEEEAPTGSIRSRDFRKSSVNAQGNSRTVR
ncbi:MAG: hypothetical protein O3A46_07745 [Candidatus Poribacteria bacterium]|nr:hypothetical protein [Candidatus Poribacteria bacterium]